MYVLWWSIYSDFLLIYKLSYLFSYWILFKNWGFIYNKMYYTYNKNCYIKNKIYYKVLAHAMKVGVFCDLQSANWRPRKAGVTVQSPESQGVTGVDPSRSRKVWEPGFLRAEGNQCSNSTIRWRVNVTFFHLFILSRPSMNWMMPTRVGKDQLLFSICQFKCSSLPETPSQTHTGVMFNLSTLRPVSWHTRLTITPAVFLLGLIFVLTCPANLLPFGVVVLVLSK